MRHAVIILWHRNIRNLSRLAEYFNDKDIDVFIHIDRRADYSSEVEAGIREEFPDIAVYRKFRVRWGGINILRAEIFLINEALRRGEYGYVHLLSGEDFPLYPLSFFKTFFERNEGKEFLEYHSFPTPKWNGGSTERLAQWWPNDLFDVGTPELRKRVMKFVSLQRRIGISRKMGTLPNFRG